MNLDPHFPNWRPYQPTRQEVRRGQYRILRAEPPPKASEPSNQGFTVMSVLAGALLGSLIHPTIGGIIVFGFILHYFCKS